MVGLDPTAHTPHDGKHVGNSRLGLTAGLIHNLNMPLIGGARRGDTVRAPAAQRRAYGRPSASHQYGS